MRNNGLYQGSRWQYRWALPQFADEMAAASGGKEKLAEQLAVFFDSSLNNQGNEVGIHGCENILVAFNNDLFFVAKLQPGSCFR